MSEKPHADPTLFASFLVELYRAHLEDKCAKSLELFIREFETGGTPFGIWEEVEKIMKELEGLDRVRFEGDAVPYLYGSALVLDEEYKREWTPDP